MLFCEACAWRTPRPREVRRRDEAAHGGRDRPHGGPRDAEEPRQRARLAPRRLLLHSAAKDLVAAMAFMDDPFRLYWLLELSEGRMLMALHGQEPSCHLSTCTPMLFGSKWSFAVYADVHV